MKRRNDKGRFLKGEEIYIECLVCGKQHKVKECEKKNAKFCSHKCYHKWTSKNQQGQNNPNWQGGKVKKNCPICRNVFLSYPCQEKKFCSKTCYGKWREENIKGANHPHWLGEGVAKNNKKKRKAIRRELGFIPLNKSFKGGEAHHIDREHVIYIFKELHQGIKHSLLRNINMKKINEVAFDFLQIFGREYGTN